MASGNAVEVSWANNLPWPSKQNTTELITWIHTDVPVLVQVDQHHYKTRDGHRGKAGTNSYFTTWL